MPFPPPKQRTGRFYYYQHRLSGTIIRRRADLCEVGTTPKEYFSRSFCDLWWGPIEEPVDTMGRPLRSPKEAVDQIIESQRKPAA